MTVRLGPGTLRGSVSAPHSKSDTHRCLIAAALSQTPTRFEGYLDCEDIQATIGCLKVLGARMEGNTMYPMSPAASAVLLCGESGTTLRLMLPVIAALGLQAICFADGGLRRRPMEPLVSVLRSHGAIIDRSAPPIKVAGKLRSGHYVLPGNVSSQFISGLLLALSLLESGGSIELTSPLGSSGYVDMTMHTMDRFAVTVMPRADGFFVPGTQRYRSPGTVIIERDWSNAAPFLVAGALGGPVTVTGLSMTSRQPDRAILSILEAFGAQVGVSYDAVRVQGGALRGIEVDVDQTPDLAPLLAALALSAQGETRLVHTARLSSKESDRVRSIEGMVRALGGIVRVKDDAITITGVAEPSGGVVDSCSDHRIAMAAAIAATVCRGDTVVLGAQAVRKSFPVFFSQFESLGGKLHGVVDW